MHAGYPGSMPSTTTEHPPRDPALPDDLDPTTVTYACWTGDHKHCGRMLTLHKPVKGRVYGTCACPTCQHVPDYRSHRGGQ